jgi:hypothetical protein
MDSIDLKIIGNDAGSHAVFCFSGKGEMRFEPFLSMLRLIEESGG